MDPVLALMQIPQENPAVHHLLWHQWPVQAWMFGPSSQFPAGPMTQCVCTVAFTNPMRGLQLGIRMEGEQTGTCFLLCIDVIELLAVFRLCVICQDIISQLIVHILAQFISLIKETQSSINNMPILLTNDKCK